MAKNKKETVTLPKKPTVTTEQEIINTLNAVRFHLLRGRSTPDSTKIIRPAVGSLKGQIEIIFRSEANLRKYPQHNVVCR